MKVTIIIPNYNGKHFLGPCLDSLSEQSCQNFEILVADNHSSDGSVEFLAEQYPDVRIIALDKNRGFSAGVRHFPLPKNFLKPYFRLIFLSNFPYFYVVCAVCI